MKKLLSAIILCLLLFSCSSEEKKSYKEFNEIVKVELKSLTKINDSSENQFYYPKIVYDGSKIFFTTKEYDGIWYYDLETQLIINVSQINKVGKEFKFSKDSKKIYYVLPSMTVRTKEKNYALVEYDLESKARNILYNNLDGISNIAVIDSNIISFWVNNDPIFFDITYKRTIQNFSTTEYLLLHGKNKFLVYDNNELLYEIELYEFEEFIGEGTDTSFYYITTFGNVEKIKSMGTRGPKNIGYYENLGVSQNSNLIFYSNNSRLFIKSSFEQKFVELKVDGLDEILNPSISFKNDSFVFNNEKGEIHFLQIEIKEKLSDES